MEAARYSVGGSVLLAALATGLLVITIGNVM